MSISILNIIMIFTEQFPRYLSFVLNLDDNQTSNPILACTCHIEDHKKEIKC